MSSTPSANSDYKHLIGNVIDNGRYLFMSVLGVGAFGVVVLAVDRRAQGPKPTYLAIKCLNNIGLDARQRKFLRRELALHRRASSHPSVVTLQRVIQTPEVVYCFLDYVSDGDLFGMITESHRYLGNDALISSVFLQLIDAVDHCHKLGVFHRDLKPENILCAEGGSQLMLADFGLATEEADSQDFGCGSTFYMSPECRGGIFSRPVSYNTAANDVWSLGVILVNLTTGRNPWRQASSTDDNFVAFLRDVDFLQTILPISSATNEILQACFEVDPVRRVSIWRLREMVKRVRRWTMEDNEISKAGEHVKAVAGEFGAAQGAKERAQRIKARRAEEARRRPVPQITPNASLDSDPLPSDASPPPPPLPTYASIAAPSPPPNTPLPPVPAPLTALATPLPQDHALPDTPALAQVTEAKLLPSPPPSPANQTARSSQSSSKSTRTLVQSNTSSGPPNTSEGKKSNLEGAKSSSSFAKLLDAQLSPLESPSVLGLGLGLSLFFPSDVVEQTTSSSSATSSKLKQWMSSPALMEAEETQVGEETDIKGKGKGKAVTEEDVAALNAAVDGLKQLVMQQQESTRKQLEKVVGAGKTREEG
ncbi:kinase-like domain-containing protein [Mrakia frigida]|uniref:kinase-like domain-containing protein n=1 Tax=Mrakia frigida TaxID=29902 RepID=UPI003FCBF5F2